jgi:short-subunit dehydrogenase
MGRALSRKLAARGERLFLLGRNGADLSRSARDLEIHGAHGEVSSAYCDLLDPGSFVQALDRADEALEKCRRVLSANFVNSVAFCEEIRRRLLVRGGGTLCAFSSVAGDRARKPVILYGAAKAGLSHYLEGLDHKFRGSGLRIVCVKPGFVKTGMTAALDPPPFAGAPEEVADVVLRAIDEGRPVVYAPPIWRWVMAIIRRLPRAVMRRVGF